MIVVVGKVGQQVLIRTVHNICMGAKMKNVYFMLNMYLAMLYVQLECNLGSLKLIIVRIQIIIRITIFV